MDTLYIILIVIAIYMAYSFFMKRGVQQISTNELKAMIGTKDKNNHFLDVRTSGEFSSRNIKGFKNIPLDQIGQRLTQIPKDKTIVLICQSGNRSSMAARKLAKAGYDKIINVKGGMNMWR